VYDSICFCVLGLDRASCFGVVSDKFRRSFGDDFTELSESWSGTLRKFSEVVLKISGM
jgi:hypothetical protein